MNPIPARAERSEIAETLRPHLAAMKIQCWTILMTSTRGIGGGEPFQPGSLVVRNVAESRMRLRVGVTRRLSCPRLVDQGRREGRRLWHRKARLSLSHPTPPILFAKVVGSVKSGRLGGPSTRLVPMVIGYNRRWSKGSGPSIRWCVDSNCSPRSLLIFKPSPPILSTPIRTL
jgi:hypothetical protein